MALQQHSKRQLLPLLLPAAALHAGHLLPSTAGSIAAPIHQQFFKDSL
jgi:hypothetical protein